MYPNQNRLVDSFNTFQQANPVPFQSNQLINRNIHVSNNLNNLMQQQRQALPQHQPQSQLPRKKLTNANIIDQMLKPQQITTDNSDVKNNFKTRKDNQIYQKFEINNAPYKSIIRDRPINKAVKEIKPEDMIVHKANKLLDANPEHFSTEVNRKLNEVDEINLELDIEFHIDNFDKHKKNFEFKESFIRNLAYEANTHTDNKIDCIDFYKKKQAEAEAGKKLCDDILRNMIDDGVVSADELPSNLTESPDEAEVSVPVPAVPTVPAVAIATPTKPKLLSKARSSRMNSSEIKEV